jgi:hypothetical protein
VVVMNMSVLWDVTRYSTLKVSRRFGILLPASRLFLAWLILRPWRWRWQVPPKLLLTFNRFRGLISQKIEFCINVNCMDQNSSREIDNRSGNRLWWSPDNILLHLFIHSVCNHSTVIKGTSLLYKVKNSTINKWHDKERYTKHQFKIMYVIKI